MALLDSICATSVSVIGGIEPQEVFSWLPVAHCVGGAVLVMHGGLSRQDGVTLEDIRRIERGGLNPERDGLMCDLLWSDPQVSQSVARILGILLCTLWLFLEIGQSLKLSQQKFFRILSILRTIQIHKYSIPCFV